MNPTETPDHPRARPEAAAPDVTLQLHHGQTDVLPAETTAPSGAAVPAGAAVLYGVAEHTTPAPEQRQSRAPEQESLKAEALHLLRRALASDEFMLGIFKGGFGFIFLINGFIAWVRPADFIRLLKSFPIAAMLNVVPQMVMFTGFHDIVLGLLILSGKWRRYVWAWAGLWLSLVALIKLVALL